MASAPLGELGARECFHPSQRMRPFVAVAVGVADILKIILFLKNLSSFIVIVFNLPESVIGLGYVSYQIDAHRFVER